MSPPLPLDVLRTVFGFDSFRGQQAEIVDHVVAGGDALVLMPTGGGKSLCFQIPGLCRPGVAVVVSPLIALMQDQVESLRQLGVRAAALNSSLAWRDAMAVERSMKAGELDLVYVAPERLLTEPFLALLDECRLALFAIDEAHCVSQWGHDFRPEYLELQRLHARWPKVPRIALTATADPPTRREIVERLGLAEGRVFVASFDRPNIRYRVSPKRTPRDQLTRFLDEHRGESGIVYCATRDRVDDTARGLAERGLTALPYHAGLPNPVRAANQDRFLKEDGVVMAATIAFGMGIDKPDVRFVVHSDPPRSLESYYQETGRAGRDGLPSDALMLYGMQDIARMFAMVEASEADESRKWIERRKLEALLGFCETTRCRRQVLLDYFGEPMAQPCGNCDICLEPVESFDGTVLAQKALSCVYRTGQRYGTAHVIDVLRGDTGERVRALGHDALSTFGIGADLGKDEWRSVFRQLVALGLLVVDVDGHGVVRLGPDCRGVLRGERNVGLRRDPQARGARKPAARGQRPVLALAGDQALFQALKALRMELARVQGVPPYVIFHDSTLVEMARRKPRDADEMAQVPGVGAAKLQRYGARFLDAVRKAQAEA